MTISQSNYTYSSTTTPATPGAATNYGAQFYFGARGESAYLSAIGYLGGSSGNFTRQIQVLGLSTSTGVNVHSNILGARVEAGYNLLPNPQGKATLQVTPFVAIAPTQIRQNGANEYFGGLGSGFYYGSNINTAVPLYLGTEISGDLQMGHNEVMKPFLRVSWAHDLMNNPMAMNAAYTSAYGPTLYANGTPSMGNMVILKGGAKYNWGTKVSAYATIDVEQGNGAYSFRGIGGSLGMMYSW
jgi:outer membrane autotransporter protein